jgi:hypothetical protein
MCLAKLVLRVLVRLSHSLLDCLFYRDGMTSYHLCQMNGMEHEITTFTDGLIALIIS